MCKNRPRLKAFGEVSSGIVCIAGIVAIAGLEYKAMQAGINGIGLATSIGAIVAIVAGFLGIKLKDIISNNRKEGY